MFNDLFWAIYWIDILADLPKNLFGILFSLFLLCGTASVAVSVGMSGRINTSILDDKRDSLKWTKRIFILGFSVVFPLFVMFSFIPSKSTMYMMLGVKTTENVVESPLGKKLQAIVDAEVDGYLAKLKPKKD